MAKKKEEEFVEHVPIISTDPALIKVYYGFKYIKEKDGTWTGMTYSISSLVSMKSLVDKWNTQIDVKGFFMGEMGKLRDVEIPNLEDLEASLVPKKEKKK